MLDYAKPVIVVVIDVVVVVDVCCNVVIDVDYCLCWSAIVKLSTLKVIKMFSDIMYQ